MRRLAAADLSDLLADEGEYPDENDDNAPHRPR